MREGFQLATEKLDPKTSYHTRVAQGHLTPWVGRKPGLNIPDMYVVRYLLLAIYRTQATKHKERGTELNTEIVAEGDTE